MKRFLVATNLGSQAGLGIVLCLVGLNCCFPVFAAEHLPLDSPGMAQKAPQTEEPAQAQNELQAGITLTRQGHFREAIPHLLAARGHAADPYAAAFDLALCYVGIHHYREAIEVLLAIHNGDRESTANLLAQAYIGDGQLGKGFAAFRRAAALEPQNEKLYLFIADACVSRAAYAMGLKVVDAGLESLPRSARLAYERGVILSQLNQTSRAEKSFARAGKLSPTSEIAYMARGQSDLLQGDIGQAVQDTQAGIKQGYRGYALVTLFGQAVDRSGMSPTRPEFTQAEKALEEALTRHPHFAPAQISLGKLMLRAGDVRGAILHLEAARRLNPGDPSVYAHLAAAYRQRGDVQKVQEMLATLAKLNREQAARYKSGSPKNKIGYMASAAGRANRQDPHPR